MHGKPNPNRDSNPNPNHTLTRQPEAEREHEEQAEALVRDGRLLEIEAADFGLLFPCFDAFIVCTAA